jgi:AcrR family transcriptional regulator
MMLELPQFEEAPRERADAARNRQRILVAAGELVADCGIEGVSMEDVAKAACVGTGTLYRRFGDRAGLAFALLEEQTRDFQEGLIRGAPPLGPGAPASERLIAFGAGYIELLETHSGLMLAAEPSGEGPHSLLATHLALLLREAAPALDARFIAEALLATLAPSHHLRMRTLYSTEELVARWGEMVYALTRR